MKARIAQNAYVFVSNQSHYNNDYNKRLREFLKSNEGELIDLETDNLFRDQYNTVNGFRIYDVMISEIIDDVREGKGRCGYCGENTENFDFCTRGASCIGFTETFTKENTFFLRHPKGLPTPIKFDKEPKFGSYYLDGFPGLGFYRLKNNRKTFDFLFDGVYFWVRSIGFTAYEKLEMPLKDYKKFRQFMHENTPVTARIHKVIKKEDYNKIHKDYKGTFSTASTKDDEKFLGKKTMLDNIDGGTVLLIEDYSFKII